MKYMKININIQAYICNAINSIQQTLTARRTN